MQRIYNIAYYISLQIKYTERKEYFNMNITELTAHELKEKLDKKELTSEEITKAYAQK